MERNENFETALSELEKTVSKLEEGNATLKENIDLYEKGVKLSNLCMKILDDAKQRVEIIKNENYIENEFDTKDESED